MWFNGELEVPVEWFEDGEIESDLPRNFDASIYVSYLDLTLAERRHQGTSWLLPVIEATLPSPEAEAELFFRVNGGGTAQASEIMEHARRLAGR